MFEIDLKSRKSIYEQVMDNLKEQILAGVIKPDEKLPSVRELSKVLTVNPNTVQKSFRELERQGYIYTVTGVGAFAHDRGDIEPDERLIAELVSKLSNDLRELYFAVPDAERIRVIIDETIRHLKQRAPASDMQADGAPAPDSPNSAGGPNVTVTVTGPIAGKGRTIRKEIKND
jgi:GntR family transcriptional regulator